MKTKYNLYQQVVLAKSIYTDGLQKGDVSTIVEIMEQPNRIGYCLEFFDSNGNTLKVIVVDESYISEVVPHSVVNYRQLQHH